MTSMYMCKTDYDHELGEAAGGTVLYASISDLKANRSCVEDCGIVEVHVSLVRVVQESKPIDEWRTYPLSDMEKRSDS